MDFNPQAYLAKKKAPAPGAGQGKSGGGFNPAAYLLSKSDDAILNGLNTAPTIQEQHPDITAADRLVVKNFTTNNEAAVNYLQKRHPDLEVSVDDSSGQIKARKRDGSEPEYRVVDPEGWQGLGEAVKDVGDVGSDIVAGLGTGAATALGGVAGLGIGSLPGAALAGGAASGGLEYLRQGIGKYLLGVDQNFDHGDAAVAGLSGAVSPFLFGTGAGSKAIAEAAAKQGVEESALAASQRGGIGRVWDATKSKVLPWLGEKSSGVSADTIKSFADNFDEIARMEGDDKAIRSLTTSTAKDVGGKLREAKQQTWKVYQDTIKDMGDRPVPLDDIHQVFQSAIAEADDFAKSTGSEASQDLVKKLQNEFNKHLTKTVDAVEPLTGMPVLDEAGNAVKQTVPIMELPLSAATKLERQLGELADLGAVNPNHMGVGNRFAQGAGYEDKVVMEAARTAKGKLAERISELLPEEALAAKDKYGELADTERLIKPLMANPKRAFSTLRNLRKTTNSTDLELLAGVDKELGSGVIDAAKKAEAYSAFAKPSTFAVSSQGTTSTSRTGGAGLAGGALGYYAGSQAGGNDGRGLGILGGFAGGALGTTIGGPAAIKRYIQMARKAGAGRDALRNTFINTPTAMGSQGILNPAFSAWLGMEKK